MLDLKDKNAFPDCMERIRAAGHYLQMVGDKLIASDEAAIQFIIDSYTLDEAKAYKYGQILDHAAALRQKAITGKSFGELASWPIKRAEANAYNKLGEAAECPVLRMEATVRGIPLADLVVKVNGNASMFLDIETRIAGVDGMHRDTVKTLKTFAEVANYDFSAGWPAV